MRKLIFQAIMVWNIVITSPVLSTPGPIDLAMVVKYNYSHEYSNTVVLPLNIIHSSYMI